MKGWVGLRGLAYSGRFTDINGHGYLSAEGPVQTSRPKSSLVRDRRSTTELNRQQGLGHVIL